jgi:hypothetical protein
VVRTENFGPKNNGSWFALPRRPPLTQRDIQARQQFGFGSVAFGTKADDRKKSLSPRWDFDDALDCLGITHSYARTKYRERLDEIFRLQELTRFGERQETSARNAEAFQRAPRQYKRRQAALEQAKKADELGKRDAEAAQRLRREARRVFRQPYLPQALEQEAARLSVSGGISLNDAFVELNKMYRSKSKPGGEVSYALKQTVQRLQGVASNVSDEFSWRGRTVPKKLIIFIETALISGGMAYPSYQHNPSKFRKLLRKIGRRPE